MSVFLKANKLFKGKVKEEFGYDESDLIYSSKDKEGWRDISKEWRLGGGLLVSTNEGELFPIIKMSSPEMFELYLECVEKAKKDNEILVMYWAEKRIGHEEEDTLERERIFKARKIKLNANAYNFLVSTDGYYRSRRYYTPSESLFKKMKKLNKFSKKLETYKMKSEFFQIEKMRVGFIKINMIKNGIVNLKVNLTLELDEMQIKTEIVVGNKEMLYYLDVSTFWEKFDRIVEVMTEEAMLDSMMNPTVEPIIKKLEELTKTNTELARRMSLQKKKMFENAFEKHLDLLEVLPNLKNSEMEFRSESGGLNYLIFEDKVFIMPANDSLDVVVLEKEDLHNPSMKEKVVEKMMEMYLPKVMRDFESLQKNV